MTLETIPLLRHLNRNELQALRFITQERQFAAGQEIFREGWLMLDSGVCRWHFGDDVRKAV